MNETTTKKRSRPSAYFREWRKKNPEKVAAIQTRYWLKRAQKMQQAAAEE